MRSGDRQRDYLVATEMYKEGRHAEALQLLDELHRERPDSKHVMYYQGLCLLALGRLTEATAVCDNLSTHHSDSGRRLTAKLSIKISERVRIDYQQSHDTENGPAHLAPLTTSSDDGHKDSLKPSPSFPRQVSHSKSRTEDSMADAPARSWRGYLIAAGIIACVILAIAVFNVHRRQVQLAAEAAEDAPLPVPEANVPDKYLEVVDFYPTDRDRAYRFIVFLTPWDESTMLSDTGGTDERVGNALVSEWPALERDTGRALRATGGSELLGGVARDRMVRTLVLPRQTTGFSGPLQGVDVKAFLPGSITDMAALTASCGKPSRVESWEHNGQCAAINGKVQWWGRVGVAVDSGAGSENGAITHVLIREYPSEKEPMPEPPAQQSPQSPAQPEQPSEQSPQSPEPPQPSSEQQPQPPSG